MVKALFRQALKTDLIKDGWTVTHDPLTKSKCYCDRFNKKHKI